MFVQGKFAFTDGSSSAAQAVTFASNVTAGNLICGFVKFATAGSVFNGITDSLGNTYNIVDSITNGDSGANTFKTFYARNIAGGACTVSLNFTGSTGVYPRIMALEYSGLDTSASVLNAHAALNQDSVGNGTNAVSSGALTTTANNCMIVGFTVDHTNGVPTLAAGTSPSFTLRTDGPTPANNFDHSASEEYLLATAGAQSANFSPSGGSGVYFFTTGAMAFQPPAPGVTGTLADNDAADALAAAGANGMNGTFADADAADAWALGGQGVIWGAPTLQDHADSFSFTGAGTVYTTLAMKLAPFFSTDTITTPGCQLYRESGGALVADGPHVTAGIQAVSNITNGYCVALTSANLTLDADGGYRGVIVWDSGGGSPFYVMDDVYIPPTQANLILGQPVPATGNVPHTVGDALNAARAEGFGKWVVTPGAPGTLTIYAHDGVTVVATFPIDNTGAPLQRG
jgi:hypothetical protein